MTVTAASQTGLDRAHITWWHVFRSEWIKFWSIRSTYIVLALAALFMIGLSALIAWGISENSMPVIFCPGLPSSGARSCPRFPL